MEEVEEDAEIVEEDVVFTWTHFFLLIAFVGIGTMVMFYFVKGVMTGFGPLEIDARKIIDHPCRFDDETTRARAADAMQRRMQAQNGGSDADTPTSTPRDGGATPRDELVEDEKAAAPKRTVRAMGRSTQLKRVCAQSKEACKLS